MAAKSTKRKGPQFSSKGGSSRNASVRFAGGYDLVVLASDQEDLAATDLPKDIQWMPPGRHDIQPKNTATGRGVKLKVGVGEGLVEKLNAQAESIRKQGHQLFVDFNHNEDNGAAAHVDSFFWAGSDPVQGGIRANVRWTDEGARALQGRKFTRFSPCFAADRSGKIGGLSTANVGGLTNRPAFAENERIVQANQTLETMDPEELEKLVATAVADALPGAIKQAAKSGVFAVSANDAPPPTGKKDEKEGEEEDEDEEKKKMKAQLAAYQAKEQEALKTRVDKIVAVATEKRFIAPKDEKAIAAFRAQAEQSPELAERLLQANATAGAPASNEFTGTVTPEGGPNERTTFNANANDLQTEITKYAAEHKVDEATAFAAVCAANPALAN